PCMHHGSKLDERYAFLKDELRETRGQGVIFALHRFCDTHLVDYQALRYRLLQDEIPCLYHEIDSSLGPGQLRTKLEAFFEILGRE
ncbi:MAG: 2-hydroxyacyl-CoA dehydratase, partial [Proteobacteria bacterium]|nr:2-hydroxyacyl-CoA dehydratase [Pseudomonadota bacterium]